MSLAIQHGFSEVVLLFFFLLLCEILSPVCPLKIFFKNLHIDIQYFMQQKYHLRGQINILHRYRTGQRSKRHGRFGALLARQHGVGDALQRAEMRNVRLNFRQQERSHLMENMIYNDLIRRGYSVDVGIVELTRIIEGRRRSSQYKIDFVVNVGNDKLYIQSALHVDTPEKKAQETFSLRNTGDFFRKIVVLDGNSKPWTDEDGVMYVGVIPFLLEDIVAEAIG